MYFAHTAFVVAPLSASFNIPIICSSLNLLRFISFCFSIRRTSFFNRPFLGGHATLKGIKTIQEIAKEYEVHPGQVADWKKTMVEGVAGVFERGSAAAGPEDFERERDQLNAKIGELTIKLDFVTKKSKQLGL